MRKASYASNTALPDSSPVPPAACRPLRAWPAAFSPLAAGAPDCAPERLATTRLRSPAPVNELAGEWHQGRRHNGSCRQTGLAAVAFWRLQSASGCLRSAALWRVRPGKLHKEERIGGAACTRAALHSIIAHRRRATGERHTWKTVRCSARRCQPSGVADGSRLGPRAHLTKASFLPWHLLQAKEHAPVAAGGQARRKDVARLRLAQRLAQRWQGAREGIGRCAALCYAWCAALVRVRRHQSS